MAIGFGARGGDAPRTRRRGRLRYGGGVRASAAEVVVGFEGERWPVAADGVGDGEKGTPVVGDAVVGGRGHGRIAGLQGGEVVLGPAGEFAAEDGFNFGVAAVEVSGDLLRFGGEEQDADRAAAEGV